MKYFQKSVFAFLTIIGHLAFGQAWSTEHKWSEHPPGYPTNATWEDAYSDYISKIGVDFFASGKHHIRGQEDCKVAATLERAVFCADHGLPLQMHVTTPSGIAVLTNNSKLPDYHANDSQEIRIQKLLSYLSHHVTVETVSQDTYPIKITRENVTPGTVELYMAGGGSNHTLTIQSIDSTGFVTAIYGTERPDVKRKDFFQDDNTSYLFDGSGFSKEFSHPYRSGKDGLRKWRHYDDPGFASEPEYDENDQYPDRNGFFQEPGESWSEAVVRHIRKYPATVKDDMRNLSEQLCHQVKVNRSIIVSAGEQRLQEDRESRGSSYLMSKDSLEFDQSSTYSRDARLKSDIQELNALVESLSNNPDREEIVGIRDNIFENCQIRYGHNISDRYSLGDFVEALMADTAKKMSDPNSSLEVKWGNASDQEVSSNGQVSRELISSRSGH